MSTRACVECGGEVVSTRRGPPPALCEACRDRACMGCGKTFRRSYRANVQRHPGTYCSRACYRSRGAKEEPAA